jgi:hypothetical protein
VPIGFTPHFRRFPKADAGAKRAHRRRGRDAAGLDEAGEADAAQLAVSGALALALGEALVVGQLQRLVERGDVIARVVAHDDRRLMRERADEVLAPERRRIGVQFARRHFHQPLDDIGRLGPSGAAIGVDRRGVGVDGVDLGVDRRNVILARQ